MVYHDNSTRAAVVVLKAIGKPNHEITGLTGVEKRTINSIYARAIERGFDPGLRPLQLEDKHLEDAHRSGRPSKRRVLREEGFRKTKPTRKPGLTKQMREERYRWCLEHVDWTLEDWKNVIWSDETSVVLNYRRGGYRIWRKADEAFVRSCIRERWKGYSEFMFWGCFSYDKKGPCHCWTPETNKEKEAATTWIDELNEKLEPIKKAEWELENGIRRLDLRNKPGRQPQWRWNKRTGKLSRRDGSGIDWYRYQTVILLPKLIPFAKECKANRPRTVV
ncbi:hypothetical protein yc1106_02799 [Curvularia clavata]|uniref:Transposase Tc1-like domain-containing protein n=1 Tax=Curvularia clavata TaxID=95742 RepID=A0A9Q8Z4H5_CURCL|nr:hypothetical protein yc1106_02799 [Curvularia clavata]